MSSDDFYEQELGSGQWWLRRNARGWNTAYGVIHGRNDESPIVEFEWAEEQTVAGLVIWNMPGPRGFARASIQFQTGDEAWQFLPETLQIKAAPDEGDLPGQAFHFSRPVQTRRIRLWCHATHQGPFGQPDVAGLHRVRFLRGKAGEPSLPPAEEQSPAFPADSGIVNVTQPPFNAKGDGVTDDTQALQRAFDECQGTRRPIFLPPGNYLISDSLRFRPGVSFGDNNVWGAGSQLTTLRLKDGVFNDPAQPQPVLTFGFHGSEEGGLSADWFNNQLRGLTIDVGKNEGAIGLQFYSNNAGVARDIVIRAQGSAGVIGLDLSFKDQNGPLLVKDLVVKGFAIGVSAGNSVNSQTLSSLLLTDQREAAVVNTGQCLTLEKLVATGPSPIVESRWGFLTLVEAELTSTQPLDRPAVTNGEFLCVVDLNTSGFPDSIRSTYSQEQTVVESRVSEFFSHEKVGNAESPYVSLLPR